MLEIHLFVNPLGMRCFRCENDVLRLIRTYALKSVTSSFRYSVCRQLPIRFAFTTWTLAI